MSSRYYIYDSYTDSVAEFGKGQAAMDALKGFGRRVKASGKRALTAARTPISGVYDKPNLAQQALGRGKAVWNSGRVGQAALAGSGLAAAGAVGGAGYAGKKAYDKKQKERSSIKGRVKRLLGR